MWLSVFGSEAARGTVQYNTNTSVSSMTTYGRKQKDKSRRDLFGNDVIVCIRKSIRALEQETLLSEPLT